MTDESQKTLLTQAHRLLPTLLLPISYIHSLSPVTLDAIPMLAQIHGLNYYVPVIVRANVKHAQLETRHLLRATTGPVSVPRIAAHDYLRNSLAIESSHRAHISQQKHD